MEVSGAREELSSVGSDAWFQFLVFPNEKQLTSFPISTTTECHHTRMIADETWVGLALCSTKRFTAKVCILRVKGTQHELTTTIVHCIWGGVHEETIQNVSNFELSPIQIHPVLWDTLVIAAKAVVATDFEPTECGSEVMIERACLPRFPLEDPLPIAALLEEPMHAPRDLSNDTPCRCVVQVLHHAEGGNTASSVSRRVRDGLLGRYVKAKSTMLLSNEVLLVVHKVVVNGEESDAIYRLGTSIGSLTVELVPSPEIEESAASEFILSHDGPVSGTEALSCPGYESLVKKLVDLLQPARYAGEAATSLQPTGVLLTGGAGVGKTRVAANVAQRLGKRQVRWLLVSSQNSLFLEPPHRRDNTDELFYIVDGLLENGAGDTDDNVRNSLLAKLAVVLDACAELRIPVLATSRDAHVDQLSKAGRLETTIEMHAPDQRQREQMLAEWFPQWVQGLAKLTAGFVAADLVRFHRLAQEKEVTTSWIELCAIANSIVPSQLAALDVQKPRLMFPGSNSEGNTDIDWSRHHMLCFEDIGGYDAMKRRLYRTVILPWRRLLDADSSAQTSNPHMIDPPTGVLFHGPSGCGKTLAAQCLGSSLGLPMIHVRTATEVLSPWVGGSEGLVRTLFAKARYASPCILFLDEIDSIASNREVEGGSGGVMSRVLSTLLNEMDGVSSGSGLRCSVLVIACSNRRESLDAALLRPGRLEEHILLDHPRESDIVAILARALHRTPHDGASVIDAVAQQLVARQSTCADVYGICREAVMHALRADDSTVVTKEDFVYAMATWYP